MTAKQKDVLLGLVVATFFAWVYVWIIPVQVPILSPVRQAALAPDFWPKNITLLIVFLGALQVFAAIFRKYPDTAEDKRAPIDEFKDFLLALLLVAYCVAAPVLGMLLASAIAMFCCMLLFGERNPLPLICYSIVVPLCMHLFLTKIAMILIPQGVLPI